MAKIFKTDQNKPLIIHAKGGPYKKHDLHYNGFEEPKKVELLIYFSQGEVLPSDDYELKFGINSLPEEFTKYDFLLCWEGNAIIVNKRVLSILSEECSQDFQSFPIIIKNFNLQNEPFENKDYVLLNFTHTVQAINKERSVIINQKEKTEKYETLTIKKLVFNENCMEGHLLARSDTSYRYPLIHPILAKKLTHCKGVEFWTDEEKYKV